MICELLLVLIPIMQKHFFRIDARYICARAGIRGLTKIRKRVILYKQWYKKLRAMGYMWHNCVEWAIYNSGTHELDGSYRKW